MIILDKLLEQRHEADNPIKVGMVGAGFMGKGVALQLMKFTPGINLVAIANRHVEAARQAYMVAGVEEVIEVENVGGLKRAIGQKVPAITQDPLILCNTDEIDAIFEVTSSIEYSAPIALEAINNHKHFITMNAELDGTIGPLLNSYAEKEGVVFTNADGDQPGVIMNLYRFLTGIGVKSVLCGNIKGLQDPYRNPTTQEGYAKKWGQKPHMVTSFADGTKISFEQAIIANATNMRVGVRGMYGPTVKAGTPIQEAVNLFPTEALLASPGVVDYVVGATPSPGVFILGTLEDPLQKHYLNLYKLGEGPLYCFVRPYHLCHFEVPNSIARAVLLNDATIAPQEGPKVDVITTAKTAIKSGQVLDPIGHYLTYGQCENVETVRRDRLLPIGVAEGCTVNRDIAKDEVLSYYDITLPANRLIDRLREKQDLMFFHSDG